MSLTQTFRVIQSDGANVIDLSKAVSSGQVIQISETVAQNQTDVAIACAVVAAKIQAILVTCDKAMTLETNSSSAPDQTFTLQAGEVAVFWHSGMATACPITDNITGLFATTPDAQGDALLRIVIVVDPT